jgi:hypothetical protein
MASSAAIVTGARGRRPATARPGLVYPGSRGGLTRHRSPGKEARMPRYLVERTVPDGLNIPITDEGAKNCLAVVANNLTEGVTWVHSYVSSDKKKTFCIYDGPNPEAIVKVAVTNGLPVDGIHEVRVLDPYFYK